MKALISSTERFNVYWISSWIKNPETNNWDPISSEILDCQRVAQVEPNNKVFEVYQTLFWVDCPDNCIADEWYFKDGAVYMKPKNVPMPEGN